MSIHQEHIVDIVKNIWSTTFSLSAEWVESDGGEHPFFLNSEIRIDGPWSGIVNVYCGEKTIYLLASTIFQKDKHDLSDQEIFDVMGEVTNMIGGNLKALLPSPSNLSLPKVQLAKESAENHIKDINQCVDMLVDTERMRIRVEQTSIKS